MSNKKVKIPKSITKMLNKEFEFGGHIFSYKKEEQPFNALVLDWRWGSATIMDISQSPPREKHPTVEFLIKNDSMKRSRWTRGFAVREIKL